MILILVIVIVPCVIHNKLDMITFWRTSDQYGCFSNFARFSVNLDGKIWPTSEHYYQAMKTTDPELQEKVRTCLSPRDAKNLAKTFHLRENWEQIKYDIMVKVIRAKVEQHTSIRDMLISTGDEEIGEASPFDYEWGLGADGTGKNLLGKVLMQIRVALRRGA